MGENHIIFSYIFIKRKHSLEAPTSNSLATIGRRLQPPILRLQPEGSYNSLILWLQLEGGYNPLGSLATTEGGYNHLSLPHPTTL
jgi:hypothetical protein